MTRLRMPRSSTLGRIEGIPRENESPRDDATSLTLVSDTARDERVEGRSRRKAEQMKLVGIFVATRTRGATHSHDNSTSMTDDPLQGSPFEIFEGRFLTREDVECDRNEKRFHGSSTLFLSVPKDDTHQ